MESRGAGSFERDRALVETMRLVGEPVEVIDDVLQCLDRSEDEREQLRRIARPEAGAETPPEMASGDVIDMNPLTSQPQRSKPR
jgi:hypothetical protein